MSRPDLTPGNALSDLFPGHPEDKAVEGSVCGSGHLVVNIRTVSSQHQWCWNGTPKATKSLLGKEISV